MNNKAVETLRNSSREIVRELGLLNGSFQDTGLNFSQCHALIELDKNDLRNSDLTSILKLEKSSVTRLIQSLKELGFVTELTDERDARNKVIKLTENGEKKLKEINSLANNTVLEAIGLLSVPEQEIVLNGMKLYAAALRKVNLLKECKIRKIEKADNTAVAKIIRSVLSDFSAGEGTAMGDPELDFMFETYNNARSKYFVAEYKGVVVGCAGIAPLKGGDSSVCELQKMYLLPEARGLGFGATLLRTALSAAASLGYKTCYLETLSVMKSAMTLYETNGFKPTKRMGNTGHSACDVSYAKDLNTLRPRL